MASELELKQNRLLGLELELLLKLVGSGSNCLSRAEAEAVARAEVGAGAEAIGEWRREELMELRVSILRLRRTLQFEVKHLASGGFFKAFHKEAFKLGIFTYIPKAFQDLVYDMREEIHICVSPQTKWIVETGDSMKLRFLQTGKMEHTISKFKHFSFTDDDVYLVYSSEGSLYALSLQTGAVLTSISDCNLYYFKRERQVGYLFRNNNEERAIFLTHLFSPFKFLPESPVKKSVVENSIAAMFRSSDTVISLNSDSMVTLWQTTTNKEAVAFICESLLKVSDPLELNVKNCVLSSDGKLIAVHQGAKIELYRFAESEGNTFHSNIYESKDEFMVPCFAFSADSTLLLFCINDSRVYPHFYVWDVEKNVLSASFKSPGLLTAECCCLSSSKQELVLCGEYQIEIWEYAKHPRLFARFAVEKPSNNVKFSHCIVSLDNHLLACCIANTIIVYSLHASDINSSKRVLRGHLGRIEFCRFLKVNRYLISYGVDGMVFLWDLVESKAVGFARITEGQDSIVSMAVSPEENRAVCFTSCDRVYVIRLRGLGSTRALTAVKTPKEETAESSQPQLERMPSASQILTLSIEDDMSDASSTTSDSEVDFLDFYLEPDPFHESE